MPSDRITIIGAGAMGAGIAGALTSARCDVVTILEGRSSASRDRAGLAGMRSVTPEEAVSTRAILSIVPPAQAEAVVATLIPVFAVAEAPPVFVDCNPLDPPKKRLLADQVTAAGGHFIDGTIIGLPPAAGRAPPRLYVSGDGTDRLAWLERYGLPPRVIAGPVGAAASLKLCYAGINKGLTALTAAMLMAAARAGVGDDLRREMEESLPWVLARSQRAIPAMYPKAARWIAEMREIADFLADDPSTAAIFDGMAAFFAARADTAISDEELRRLCTLLT